MASSISGNGMVTDEAWHWYSDPTPVETEHQKLGRPKTKEKGHGALLCDMVHLSISICWVPAFTVLGI